MPSDTTTYRRIHAAEPEGWGSLPVQCLLDTRPIRPLYPACEGYQGQDSSRSALLFRGALRGTLGPHAGRLRLSRKYDRYHQDTHKTGPPKTENSVRCITMPSVIMQEILTYTGKIYGIKSPDRVFTFIDSLLRGNIERGAEKAGIIRIRIHDLRHPYVKPTTKNNIKTAIANIFLHAYNCCPYPHGNR